MRKIVLTEEMKVYINDNRLNMTMREIANKLKVNHQTIRSYLNWEKLDYKICAKKNRQDLTIRENEIMELIAKGLSNKEISQKLDITVSTLKTHLGHIYQKYGLTGLDTRLQRLRAVLRFQKEKNQ